MIIFLLTPVERLLAPEVYVLASQERVYGVCGQNYNATSFALDKSQK